MITDNKLNLGSGLLFMNGYVNFDFTSHGGFAPDVKGRIEDLLEHFEENRFEEIIMVHVFEHFHYTDCIKILKDCLFLLKPCGKLIIEGPCILGVYQHYWVEDKDATALVEQIFADEAFRLKYGNEYTHKWGWTGEMVGKEMENVGFSTTAVAKCTACGGEGGKIHLRPFRDFRVEGIK